ncbi:MAG: hypothetical protein A2Y38_04310 [Spirochaetes bacterium GWB1_59_5]|nr:MAG: hypothetical protein A2Y38_04310 [Spirochaetes bacterium GWB1_59_5]
MRIELAVGCPKFAAPDAGVRLDIYAPEATIEEITPQIQEGLDRGWIVVKEMAIQEEEPTEEPAEIEEEKEEEIPQSKPAFTGKRPLQEEKCKTITKSGSQCKKNALKYSDFCPIHATEAQLAEVDVKLAAEG